LTTLDKDRVYLVTPVSHLSQAISQLQSTKDIQIEHIYDY